MSKESNDPFEQAKAMWDNIGGAIEAVTSIAKVVGAYYNALVDLGVPQEVASELAQIFQINFMANMMDAPNEEEGE